MTIFRFLPPEPKADDTSARDDIISKLRGMADRIEAGEEDYQTLIVISERGEGLLFGDLINDFELLGLISRFEHLVHKLIVDD